MTIPTPNNSDTDQHLLDFDQDFQRVIEEEMRQHQESIRELGHPEWCVDAFQELRRLSERLAEARRTTTNEDDIPTQLNKILSLFPQSFFDYDEKCKSELEAACQELKDYLNKSSKSK